MQAIYDLTIEELENYFEAKNEKIYTYTPNTTFYRF